MQRRAQRPVVGQLQDIDPGAHGRKNRLQSPVVGEVLEDSNWAPLASYGLVGGCLAHPCARSARWKPGHEHCRS